MKNIFLAIASGVLLAIAWPTYGFPLFLFVAFVPLLIAEYKIRTSNTKKSKSKVIIAAYITFVIFNFFTTWWLFYATPFGMFFANLVNALLMALLFVIYHMVAKKISRKLSLVFLAMLWIGFEKFHLNWEFSWPWLNLGNGFADYHKWIQWYEYTGAFGGTLWIWIVNIIVFRACTNFMETQNKKQLTKGILAAVGIVVIGIFSSLYIYHTFEESEDKVNVVVLQPNVDPYSEKYAITNEVMAKDLIELAKTKLNNSTTFVIAPETTLSKPKELKQFKNTQEYRLINDFIKTNPRLSFVSGITFFESHPASQKPNKTANFFRNSKQWYNSYNSAFSIQNDNKFNFYHKSKLVVGVEHIPYRNLLAPLLGSSMIDLGGSVSTLSTQKERSIFSNQINSLAPIICYESVYGEYVTDYVKKGADFLAIITNDGWWNTSQGHKQHLSIARLRAIETRRSIARAANTGISALINQKGDLVQSIPYGQKGALNGAISTNKQQTYYTTHGDYIYRVSMFILVIIVLVSFTKRRKA